MLRIRHLPFFILSFFVFSHAAFAEFRIATVDLGRILNESDEAQSKKKELSALSDDAKKKAEAKRKSLEAMETKLKEAKVAEDSKEAENFRNEAKQYARFIKDTEEDLKKRFMRVNRDITDKVLKTITAYAKENNLDLVLDKSEQMRGPILFGDSSVDITSKIISDLN